MNLNLGCGRLVLPGFVGLDRGLSPSVHVRGSVVELPFRDETADFVYAGHVIEHIPDSVLVHTGNGGFREALGLDQAKEEIRRVLRPGGKIMIRVPYKESYRFDIHHFKEFDKRSFVAWTDIATEALTLQELGGFVIERQYVSSIIGLWHAKHYLPGLYRTAARRLGRREFSEDGRFRVPFSIPGLPKELTVVLRKKGASG